MSFTDNTILNFGSTDPFKAATFDTDLHDHYIHIRIKQRSGRKSITTVEGLSTEEATQYLADIKKKFCCNGSLQTDEHGGIVIQLSGDQRKPIAEYLVGKKKKKENIKIHGF
jgi:translation initiation factor 1